MSHPPGGSGGRHDLGGLGPRDRAGAARAVRRAAADLARRLKVNQREITLQKLTPMTWPDASLGCPEPDRMYAQVLTPGYAVLLASGPDEYEYRTDGGRILICVGRKDAPG